VGQSVVEGDCQTLRAVAFMGWDWATIESEWLGGTGPIASPQAAIVESFDLVEKVLGRKWMEEQLAAQSAPNQAPGPVASFVRIAEQLVRLRGCVGFSDVLRRMLEGQRAAFSELRAAYLCVVGHPDAIVEFNVAVTVGKKARRPDFRVCMPGDDWTHVEVKSLQTSEQAEKTSADLETLSQPFSDMPLGLAAEIFLHREPAPDEITAIINRARCLFVAAQPGTVELPGLAVIYIGHQPPGEVSPFHTTAVPTPMLSEVKFQLADGRRKHLLVRYPYSDARAKEFLDAVSKQLPPRSGNLAMADVSGAVSALRSWEALLLRRLQPNQHTRISAICMFSTVLGVAEGGFEQVSWTKLLQNPHAAVACAPWLLDALSRWKAPAWIK
jgi:hypothetical protein